MDPQWTGGGDGIKKKEFCSAAAVLYSCRYCNVVWWVFFHRTIGWKSERGFTVRELNMVLLRYCACTEMKFVSLFSDSGCQVMKTDRQRERGRERESCFRGFTQQQTTTRFKFPVCFYFSLPHEGTGLLETKKNWFTETWTENYWKPDVLFLS